MQSSFLESAVVELISVRLRLTHRLVSRQLPPGAFVVQGLYVAQRSTMHCMVVWYGCIVMLAMVVWYALFGCVVKHHALYDDANNVCKEAM